jgi:DNA-binding NtrC family response regulator
MPVKTLLTFTGFHDPYAIGLVGQAQQPGPILSLAQARPFGRIILFSTPSVEPHARATAAALAAACPRTEVRVIHLPLHDPTDYAAILRNLRRQAAALLTKAPDDEYFIAAASGTPQMHACWVLLVAGGEIPARILHVRPARYVTRRAPMVSEVDLSAPEFPEVRAAVCREAAAPAYAAAGGLPEAARIGLAEAMAELGIVAEDARTLQALHMAAAVAAHDAPVLIQGETGTGKELIARLIHRLSGRDPERFVALNCGSLPANLIESLLFGHVRGAFTGAVADQTGKFEQADGGTLFLDEVGELPPEVQPKFLRVLEDGLVEAIGARRGRRVNARVVAATNVDLPQAVERGAFREDLYYRLSFATIRLPPLRERRADIPRIALHLLDDLNRSMRRPKRLAPEALARLQAQPWKGNVRDLENVLGRSMLLARGDILRADDLLIDEPRKRKDPLAALPDPQEGFRMEEYLKSARKQFILRALDMARGSQSGAARMLGLSPQAVHKFLKDEGGRGQGSGFRVR